MNTTQQISIPVDNSIKIFGSTQLNPYVSKCKVKVFYVGRNRNGTYFDEETAQTMGSKLPGSPIVGYYNAEKGDFEEHEREFGYDPVTKKYTELDMTKPYGFVAPDAPVWFETFQENGVEHKYVCTECYIWTGIYPESKRIVTKGNNQSMELNKQDFSGTWTEDLSNNTRFFIVNEAVIEKLCILGEDQTPCFEGSQFKTTFSFHEEFEALKQSMYSLMQTIKEQGGLNNNMDNDINKNATEPTEPTSNYACGNGDDDKKKKFASDNDDKKKKEDENKDNNNKSSTKDEPDEGNNKPSKNDDQKDKNKKKYSLEEVVEYQALKTDYAILQRQYSALESEKNALIAEIEPLRIFKAQAEKAEKEAMINSFYMLSDEDKKDVVANMDKYTLDEIESKLAVIGMRNKVNFGLTQEDQSKETSREDTTLLFNLQSASVSDDSIPAWVKAVQETEKNWNN